MKSKYVTQKERVAIAVATRQVASNMVGPTINWRFLRDHRLTINDLNDVIVSILRNLSFPVINLKIIDDTTEHCVMHKQLCLSEIIEEVIERTANNLLSSLITYKDILFN